MRRASILLIWAGAFGAASGDLLASAPRSSPESREPADELGAPAGQPCPVCRYAARHGLRMMPLHRVRRDRCGAMDVPFLAVLPRGRVRASDLDVIEVELGADVPDEIPPNVLFRMARSPIGRLPIPGEEVNERVPLPRALVREMDGLRGRIDWGAFLPNAPDSVASIWVEEPRPEERKRFGRVLEEGRRVPQWIRQVVHAKALFDSQYDYAALRAARAVLAARANEPHAAAVAYAAYANMGLARILSPAIELGWTIEDRLRPGRNGAQAPCDLDHDDEGRYLRPGASAPRPGCGG